MFKLVLLVITFIFLGCNSDSGKIEVVKDSDNNNTNLKEENKSNEVNASNKNADTDVNNSISDQRSFGKIYINESAVGDMPPSPKNLDDLLK